MWQGNAFYNLFNSLIKILGLSSLSKKFLCPLRWRTQKCNVTKSFIFGIILMMMTIVVLFLGCTPSNFNIPGLHFKVAHPKVQCNPGF